MYLLVYTFVHNNDDTHKYFKVKGLLEEELKFMFKYVNGGESLMNYTDIVNIFNSRNEDGANMGTLDNITSHRKLSGDY